MRDEYLFLSIIVIILIPIVLMKAYTAATFLIYLAVLLLGFAIKLKEKYEIGIIVIILLIALGLSFYDYTASISFVFLGIIFTRKLRNREYIIIALTLIFLIATYNAYITDKGGLAGIFSQSLLFLISITSYNINIFFVLLD